MSIDLLEWRRRRLEYEARERRERSGRLEIGDPTPWHAGVQEQVNRDILDRLEALEKLLKMKPVTVAPPAKHEAPDAR